MIRRRMLLGPAAGAVAVALLLLVVIVPPGQPSRPGSMSGGASSRAGDPEGGANLRGRPDRALRPAEDTEHGVLTVAVRRDGRAVAEAYLCAMARAEWSLHDLRRPLIWTNLQARAAARTRTDEEGMGHLEVSGPGPFAVMASTDDTHVDGYLWKILPGESLVLELPARRAPLVVTVRTVQGAPVGGARVRLCAGDAAGAGFALEGVTGEDGTLAFTLPARPRWCSIYADHPEVGSGSARPEELGESVTVYLEEGRTVSIRVVDEAQQPLAAAISCYVERDVPFPLKARSEGLQTRLDVSGVPRRARLCVWAVAPDGRFGLESREAPQDVELMLGPAAEVACRIASPVEVHGEGGVWLVPAEAHVDWSDVVAWGGAELREHYLVLLSAQSDPTVLSLPTGPRPTRTFRAQLDLRLAREWPDLRVDAGTCCVRGLRNVHTEAVLRLALVQETVVEGVVRAASNGEPLAGVTVGTGYFDTDVLTRTGASGHYRVVVKETRPFRLIFRGEGLGTFASELVEPAPGESVELDATLGRAGSVPGRVLTADGTGLPDVRVRLFGRDGALLADTRTDAHGCFHLEDVPTGRARVRADLGEHATPWEDALEADVEIPALRDPLQLREVTLRTSPGYRTATVWGPLTGAADFGRAGATFELLLRGRGERAGVVLRATIRRDGYTFERVPFGEYDVCYVVSQGGVSVERTMTPFEVDEHPIRCGFHLPSSGYLYGRVVDERGAPIGGAHLAVVDAQTGATASAGPSLRTDRDGVFALDLMQGCYRVEVRSEGLAGRSREIRLLPRALESSTVVARRGGSIRLLVRVAAAERIDLSYALEGPTPRRERLAGVAVQDGVAAVPIHGLEAGTYTVGVLLGGQGQAEESVEVSAGEITPVWIPGE